LQGFYDFDMEQFLFLILLVLILYIAFHRVLERNARRVRKISGMSLDGGSYEDSQIFAEWKHHAIRRLKLFNASIHLAILMWWMPFLFFGLLFVPFLASGHRRKAEEAQALIPALPKGWKWLDGKNQGDEDSSPKANRGRVFALAGGGCVVLVIVFFGMLNISNKGPMISGKPIKHWVDRVSDLDLNVSNEAVDKLKWAEKEHLEKYRSELEKAAKNNSQVADLIKWKFSE
jgi:preprotein translocase subunit YajC